jgi:hypothetical protein
VTKILFSFDTEDYINSAAEEGVMRLARALEAEGLRGCFCVVAEAAQAWRRRGSHALLGALRAHEVNGHSWRHSWHPNIAEYSEDADWDRSLARFLREERYGMDVVMDVCHRDRLWAFIKPGNATSAQAIYGYTLLGSSVFGDGILSSQRGRGLWYCNALNLSYDWNMEEPLIRQPVSALQPKLDEWATWHRVILYAHPTKTIHTEFWDGINMRHGNPPTWGDWKPSPQRPREDIERFFASFCGLIRMLKAHGGFEFETYEDAWRAQPAPTRRQLNTARLQLMLSRAAERLTWQADQATGESYTPAELFAAAVDVLAGRIDPWDAWAAMGPVSEPQAITEPVTLSAEAIRAAAAALRPVVYIPAAVQVGRATLGPGDFLRAMAQALQGNDAIRLTPGPQLPEAADWPALAQRVTSSDWLYPVGWTSEWVDKRLRWQAWTVRPAARG